MSDAHEYTPTTEEVRWYVSNNGRIPVEWFDRWLAAHAEPDNDEREIAEAMHADDCADDECDGGDMAHYDRLANIAAGFRRSSRVPVSQDELLKWVSHNWVDIELGGWTGPLTEHFDIFPKAERKPADSANGDEQ